MANAQFYVYVLRDPRPGKNNAPIYVGKGKGNRANFHRKRAANPRLARIIAKCDADGFDVKIEKIRHFGIEADAFAYEIELIALYGRFDLRTGTLCNLTNGGEGACGLTLSEEQRKASRERATRRSAKPEWRAAQKAAKKLAWSDPELRARQIAGMKRVAANPEWLDATSRRMKRLWTDPRHQAKQKAGAKRAAADPEWRAAISERMKRMWSDPEQRAKQKAGMKRAASDSTQYVNRKAAWTDPEVRAKRIAGIKRAAAARTAAVLAHDYRPSSSSPSMVGASAVS